MFVLLFSMNKGRRTNEASLLLSIVFKRIFKTSSHFPDFEGGFRIFKVHIYCQTQKTVNTWKISGMLIVYWPITIKFRTCEQTSKPQTNYRCCLWFSYLAPYWLISRNTITFHKYFWCSRFCEFHSKLKLSHTLLNFRFHRREQFFHYIRICTCLSVHAQKWKTDYQHVISSKKYSGHLKSTSALKVHFDTFCNYLYFSLRLARFHYKNCKNTRQSLRFRLLFFLPNLLLRRSAK